MPWQRLVLDVALELDDDANFVYREVVLLVPRQAGKTAIDLGLTAWRALAFEGFARTVLAEQDRNHARTKFIEEWMPCLEASEIGDRFTLRKTNGSEAIYWDTGAISTIIANTETSGHGLTRVGLAIIDEAFALTDNRLEQALAPTQATVVDAQTWITSAAGDDRSEFLRAKRDRGRDLAIAGVTEGIAYFEWSAYPGELNTPVDPDAVVDVDDPEVWVGTHPAVGFTIDERTVAADHARMDRDEFARSYLCIWPGSSTRARVVPPEEWEAHYEAPQELVENVTLAVEASPDLATGCLAVAGRREDGRLAVEIIAYQDGARWLPAAMARWKAKNRGGRIVCDGKSPAASLWNEFVRLKCEPEKAKYEDVHRAAAAFVHGFTEGDYAHPGAAPLDRAVERAIKLQIAKGDAFTFGRESTDDDIAPLRAAALALHFASAPSTKKKLPNWVVRNLQT